MSPVPPILRSRARLRRATLMLLVLATPAVLAACDGQTLLAGDERMDARTDEVVQAGLLQSVTVRSAPLLDQRDVEVRSVLTNTGSSALALTSRICGLDYAGTLAVSEIPGLMRCLAYSGQGVLAVGDSVEVSDLSRVACPGDPRTSRAPRPRARALGECHGDHPRLRRSILQASTDRR